MLRPSVLAGSDLLLRTEFELAMFSMLIRMKATPAQLLNAQALHY